MHIYAIYCINHKNQDKNKTKFGLRQSRHRSICTELAKKKKSRKGKSQQL